MWRRRGPGRMSPHLRCSVYPISPRNWGAAMHDSFPQQQASGCSQGQLVLPLVAIDGTILPGLLRSTLPVRATRSQGTRATTTFGARPEPTSVVSNNSHML